MQKKLDQRSIYLRKLIIRGLAGGNRGHVGSSMSLVEILRVLYDKILTKFPSRPNHPKRDRLIFSKGHGCLALYAILSDFNYFNKKELDIFCQSDSILGGHPDIEVPGVEVTSGSLGHGPSIGVGIALSAKIKKEKFKVFTIIGDGELGEGSIWESLMYASKYNLDNFYLIIDKNGLQTYGDPEIISGLTNIKSKFKSFGFEVKNINGHDIKEIEFTIKKQMKFKGKPHVLICNTIKGMGIGFAENQLNWHHKSSLSKNDIDLMLDELNNIS